jgi:glycosyltransferase involved in cell wall biosynthesis
MVKIGGEDLSEIRPLVSIVMTVRNVSKTITNCLNSILNQSFKDFEIILIDDFSIDNTQKIIHEIYDKRIKYFKNKKWCGITLSRNSGIKKANGKYIFFTDGDCVVSKNWIEEGLKKFEKSNCIGVEGRIYYVSKDYKPTFSDHVMENISGGNYMTGNIAYAKAALKRVKGFNEELAYLEDRDIAFRIMKYGKICFNPKMVVYHTKVTMTPKKLIKSASHAKKRVHLYKKYKRKEFMLWRIIYPLHLAKLIFPFLIFSSLFFKRFKSIADFRLFPFTYPFLIYQRLQIWKESANKKIFLI